LQHIIDSHFNSILVFDWEVLESCMARIGNYYTFLDGLRMLSREHGEFVVIVSEKSRAELEDKLGFLLVSNITLFLNSGREVRVNGTWIHPYEKLDGTIEYLRRKVYNYQREVGGEVKETANCLTYHCVEDGLLPEASFFSPS
jgi:trehalose-6-phosphatase